MTLWWTASIFKRHARRRSGSGKKLRRKSLNPWAFFQIRRKKEVQIHLLPVTLAEARPRWFSEPRTKKRWLTTSTTNKFQTKGTTLYANRSPPNFCQTRESSIFSWPRQCLINSTTLPKTPLNKPYFLQNSLRMTSWTQPCFWNLIWCRIELKWRNRGLVRSRVSVGLVSLSISL